MLAISLLLVWTLAACPAAAAEPGPAVPSLRASYVERLPEGQIDWGSGLIQAKGVSAGGRQEARDTVAQALEEARRGLAAMLRRIPVASETLVCALLEGNEAAASQLANIVGGAQVVERKFYSDGGVEVRAALSMRGGFMQLVLPQEVTSITALRHVNGAAARPGQRYSGLVVDARGLGARPALCPRLLCEDGSEVFGPALVGRESAVQQGIAAYATALPEPGEGRTGKRPLLVRGLKAAGANHCDIVVSLADARKVRAAPESVEFLQRCRVLVVLD
jgi:hypothetical protein